MLAIRKQDHLLRPTVYFRVFRVRQKSHPVPFKVTSLRPRLMALVGFTARGAPTTVASGLKYYGNTPFMNYQLRRSCHEVYTANEPLWLSQPEVRNKSTQTHWRCHYWHRHIALVSRRQTTGSELIPAANKSICSSSFPLFARKRIRVCLIVYDGRLAGKLNQSLRELREF